MEFIFTLESLKLTEEISGGGWRDNSVIKSIAALPEDLGSIPNTHGCW